MKQNASRKNVMINLAVSPETKAILIKEAEAVQRTLSGYLRYIIQQHLDGGKK